MINAKIELVPLRICVDEKSVPVTLREAQVFSVILSHGPIPEKTIINYLWQKEKPKGNIIAVYVFNLRRKIKKIGLTVKCKYGEYWVRERRRGKNKV